MKNKIDENFISSNKNLVLGNPERLLHEKEVITKYGNIFNPKNLNDLTKEEFKSFLLFKNNKHWENIHRQGNIITKDMDRLRKALKILLDENKDIRERLDFLFPPKSPNYIKGLGRAIVTPILMVAYPKKYGVWNSKSERGLSEMGLFPKLKTTDSFSYKYIKINKILNELAEKHGLTLWQLDRIIGWVAIGVSPSDNYLGEEGSSILSTEDPEKIESYENFGLESQLEEFLIENWDKLDISKEYSILEENGDIMGQQYFTPIGVIDILAKSKNGKEWLVIELKKGKTSDRVVGQILKYIGWVSEELAGKDEKVKGLVVAGEIDEKLKYALKTTKDIKMMTYIVNFKLSEHL